jgi:hypothetical protein
MATTPLFIYSYLLQYCRLDGQAEDGCKVAHGTYETLNVCFDAGDILRRSQSPLFSRPIINHQVQPLIVLGGDVFLPLLLPTRKTRNVELANFEEPNEESGDLRATKSEASRKGGCVSG